MSGALWRRASAATVGVSLAVAASVATAPAASATTHSEQVMARLINRERAARDIAALRLSESLSRIARAHSARMRDAGDIFHSTNLAYRLRAYTWRYGGENVGMGSSIGELHRAFMASRGHRWNILARGYRYVGVGVTWDANTAFVTEIFLG